jgi:hypothetical protein
MDEQAAFETRAILAPERACRSKLALLVPVVGFVAVALAGVSGPREEPASADRPNSTVNATSRPAVASVAPGPAVASYPEQVLGFDVQPLDEVRLALLTRDDVIAISGWYVALAITDCPQAAPPVGDNSMTVSPGFDPWAWCERSGVLYAAKTGFERGNGTGPTAVAASIIDGVRMPGLETIGAAPIPVVVLGHFVETSTACMGLGMCPSELVVDHLAWSPGA